MAVNCRTIRLHKQRRIYELEEEIKGLRAKLHYLHGVRMGRTSELLDIGVGSLMKLFRRCADLFEALPAKLIEEYRQAVVKHADETGWRQTVRVGT